MSSYLLDTNILSELVRPKPNVGVVKFLQDLDQAYLSVLTIHELHYGIERLPKRSKKRVNIAQRIEGLLDTFSSRILPITVVETRIAASMRADQENQGRTVHLIDAHIAATSLSKDLTLVTRNEKDFKGLNVKILNPWV